MPETQIRFHKPVNVQNAVPQKSNMISQAIRAGIDDLRKYPTLESRKEEIINQLYEEA